MQTEMTEKTNAYEINVDMVTEEIIIRIKKGIAGPVGNQLITTSDKRKAARILRRLGHDIKAFGDQLYNKENL
jgi:ABC-type siderophore export system fused ATPase/permease subunit